MSKKLNLLFVLIISITLLQCSKKNPVTISQEIPIDLASAEKRLVESDNKFGLKLFREIIKDVINQHFCWHAVDRSDHGPSFENAVMFVEVARNSHGVIPYFHVKRKRGESPVICPVIICFTHSHTGMSAMDLVDQRSKDMPGELLFSHTVADVIIVF